MYRNRCAGSLIICLFLGCWSHAADKEENTTAADEHMLRTSKVATDGPGVLDYLRKRTFDTDPDKIKAMIRQLGDESYQTREKASAQLTSLGAVAVPALQQAVKESDQEIVRRAEDCLRQINNGAAAPVAAAAVRLVALRKPAGAAETLLAFLPFADNDAVAAEVQTALAAVAVRDGKPDPALVNGLTDKFPLRRAAAAEALAASGVAEHRPAIRKLLQDPEAEVRLKVAVALAYLKDKEAIPILIDLLPDLSVAQRANAEDILYFLADKQAPTVPAGSDQAGRRKYRDAWAAWWKENEAKADLDKLQKKPRYLGHTLVVLLDMGRVADIDSNKRVVWQIDGLQFPLDVQVLADRRVLIAEHGANLVTERDHTGKILWQKAVSEPLQAQRLPNGNTFIGTKTQLLEVDRTGKEVWTKTPPDGEQFMRVQKLSNGDIACVASTQDNLAPTQHFLHWNAAGKELENFPVDVRTYGGKIEVLPNQRILVPEIYKNRVVEYDTQGKSVAELTVDQPIVATRLPNGNTLVTSMTEMRTVEFDAAGKQVWEYRADTRVTRAYRH